MKFGSASVPVYRSTSNGRIRFTVCSYRDGKRIRKVFPDLATAKKEALFVAQRIQSGLQHVTDLKPHERNHYKKALELLGDLKLPLVAAVEDYVQARKLAKDESPSILFKHYRELATEEQADAWFAILPKEDQWQNTVEWNRRTRTITLPHSQDPPRSIRAPRTKTST